MGRDIKLTAGLSECHCLAIAAHLHYIIYLDVKQLHSPCLLHWLSAPIGFSLVSWHTTHPYLLPLPPSAMRSFPTTTLITLVSFFPILFPQHLMSFHAMSRLSIIYYHYFIMDTA